MFSRLRSYAITGTLVMAPAAVSIWILYSLVTWLDAFFIDFIPLQYRPSKFFGIHIPGTGLVAAIILVVLVGMLARNFVGMWLMRQWERLVLHIPGFNSVYSAVKQILETITSSSNDAFREVVLVEYPKKDMWAMAFLTGTTKGHVQRVTPDEVVNIFLPTTPNPTSGFLLFVPRKNLIKLDMTVEQGVKMVISGGMVTPTTAEGRQALKEEKQESEKPLGDEPIK